MPASSVATEVGKPELLGRSFDRRLFIMGEDGLELFQRLDLQAHQGVCHRQIIGGVGEAESSPLAFIVPDPSPQTVRPEGRSDLSL